MLIFRLFDDPLVMGFFLFIFSFLLLSQPSTCRSDHWFWYLSHQHISDVFGVSCKAESYCSGITSTLMQPGVQMQRIQCGGSNFLLRYFSTLFCLIPLGVYPFKHDCSLLCSWWMVRPFDLYSALMRRCFSLDNVPNSLWPDLFHGPLICMFSLVFTCPWARPTTQYLYMGPSSLQVYFKILSMNFSSYYYFFLQWVMDRFVIASVLVLDKFCIFILNLSVLFFY